MDEVKITEDLQRVRRQAVKKQNQGNDGAVLLILDELIERIARAEAQVAAFEAQLKQAKDGWDSCIADLREAGRICKATEDRLKALDWTPITAENLPKPMEDELLRPRLCSDGSAFYDVDRAGLTNLCVEAWLALGYTHRRPVNPPHPGVSTGDAGTDERA